MVKNSAPLTAAEKEARKALAQQKRAAMIAKNKQAAQDKAEAELLETENGPGRGAKANAYKNPAWGGLCGTKRRTSTEATKGGNKKSRESGTNKNQLVSRRFAAADMADDSGEEAPITVSVGKGKQKASAVEENELTDEDQHEEEEVDPIAAAEADFNQDALDADQLEESDDEELANQEALWQNAQWADEETLVQPAESSDPGSNVEVVNDLYTIQYLKNLEDVKDYRHPALDAPTEYEPSDSESDNFEEMLASLRPGNRKYKASNAPVATKVVAPPIKKRQAAFNDEAPTWAPQLTSGPTPTQQAIIRRRTTEAPIRIKQEPGVSPAPRHTNGIVPSVSLKLCMPDQPANTVTSLSRMKAKSITVGDWEVSKELFEEVALVFDGRNIKATGQPSRVRTVVDAALPFLNYFLTFKHSFPGHDMRIKFSLDALLHGATEMNDALITKLLQSGGDYGPKLAAIPNGRISTTRGKILRVVESKIQTAYKFKRNDGVIVRSWLDDNKYIFPGDVMKKNGLDGAHPYGHPIIAEVAEEFFFTGEAAVGNLFSHKFCSSLAGHPEPEMPAPMLALVATAVYAGLKQWENGLLVKMEFSGALYESTYEKHVNILDSIKKKSARAYHRMMADLLVVSNGGSFKVEDESSEFASLLNIGGMAE